MAKTDLQQMPFGFGGPPSSVRASGPPKPKSKPLTKFEQYQKKLKQREGKEYKIYKDKKGVLHGGIGHKLTEAEKKKYKVGDPVSQGQMDSWFNQDSMKAWKSAGLKGRKLGALKLQSAIAPLDFQLGENWNKEHKKTWALLEQRDYAGAAKEAEDSKWFTQTEIRVRDFQDEIRKLPSETPLMKNILRGGKRADPEEERKFLETHPYYGEVKGDTIFINERRLEEGGSTGEYVDDMFFGEALHNLKETSPEWYTRLYKAAQNDPEVMKWKEEAYQREVAGGYKGTREQHWNESRFDQVVGGFLLGGSGANIHTMRGWPKSSPFGTGFRKELEAFQDELLYGTKKPDLGKSKGRNGN